MGSLARAAVLMLAVLVGGGCATLRHGLRGGAADFGAPVELPSDATAMGEFLRGQVALTRNDYDTALPAFEAAVAADPNTPLLRLRLASLYVRAGPAREGARAVPASWSPRSRTTPRRSGSSRGILSALGRDDEAVATYERLLEIDPGQPGRVPLSGRALQQARRDRPRRRDAEEAGRARTRASILGYYYLGRVYAAARQLDKAERYYLEALKLNPQSELILTDLALAYELQGRTDKAIELYQRILALNPQSVTCAAGSAASTSGRSGSTRRSSQFRELETRRHRSARGADEDRPHLPREGRPRARRDRVQPGARRRARELARALLPRRRPTPSAARSDRAIDGVRPHPARRPSTTSTRASSAPTCCRRPDRLDEAVDEIEQALEAKPDNPELMGYLAALYRERKDLKGAIALLERLVERYPDNDRYRFTLGAAYDEAQGQDAHASSRCSARSSSIRRTPRRSTTSATPTPRWACSSTRPSR